MGFRSYTGHGKYSSSRWTLEFPILPSYWRYQTRFAFLHKNAPFLAVIPVWVSSDLLSLIIGALTLCFSSPPL
jgi:hypothetical protein